MSFSDYRERPSLNNRPLSVVFVNDENIDWNHRPVDCSCSRNLICDSTVCSRSPLWPAAAAVIVNDFCVCSVRARSLQVNQAYNNANKSRPLCSTNSTNNLFRSANIQLVSQSSPPASSFSYIRLRVLCYYYFHRYYYSNCILTII